MDWRTDWTIAILDSFLDTKSVENKMTNYWSLNLKFLNGIFVLCKTIRKYKSPGNRVITKYRYKMK